MKKSKSMKKLNSGKGLPIGFVIVTMVILGLMMLAPIAAAAANPNPNVLPPNSKPYGLTYGEWGAKWWKWAFSIGLSENPLVDDTGDNAANGQSGPVWFLAGKMCTLPCGNPDVATANREVNVPAGKALFFPILNVENDNLFNDPPLSEDALREVADAQMDTGENLLAELDGVSINKLGSALTTPYRVTSPVFTYHIPDNNIYGLFKIILDAQDVPGAIDDGVYLMLAPLPVGRHIIHFKGDFPKDAPFGAFALDITYIINVVPDKS
jgi:hypothetical protein